MSKHARSGDWEERIQGRRSSIYGERILTHAPGWKDRSSLWRARPLRRLPCRQPRRRLLCRSQTCGSSGPRKCEGGTLRPSGRRTVRRTGSRSATSGSCCGARIARSRSIEVKQPVMMRMGDPASADSSTKAEETRVSCIRISKGGSGATHPLGMTRLQWRGRGATSHPFPPGYWQSTQLRA